MMPEHVWEEIVKKHCPAYKNVGSEFLRYIREVITPASLIVDVGCGRETFGAEVYALAAKRIGIDRDAYARENTCMDEVHVVTSDSFPVASASADIVTAQWVGEHVADPHAFLAECARMLKPGGYFVFMTPNIRSPFMHLSALLPTKIKAVIRQHVFGFAEDETFPTYYAMNTVHELRILMRANGFTEKALEEIESYGYFALSRVTLLLSVYFAKCVHACFPGRAMHIVGIFVKT